MATVNGATVSPHPPPSLPPSSQTIIKEIDDSAADAIAALKRKRSDTAAVSSVAVINGDGGDAGKAQDTLQSDDVSGMIQDIKIVLQKYDTSPSVLNFELPKLTPRKASPEEHATKRVKLDDAPTTISARIQSGYYSTLQELDKDVDVAAAELLKPLLLKEQSTHSSAFGSRSSLTKEDTRFWTEILAFQKLLKGIFANEKLSRSRGKLEKSAKAGKWSEDKPVANGIVPKIEEVDAAELLADGGKVLTLFANASGHKQLFSSFQKPTGIDDTHGFTKAKEHDPSSVQVTMHLRDTGLPNILSSTTIPHLHIADTTKATKSRPTIGELFAPPRHLPPLKAPEPSKPITTKDNTLSFVPRDTPRTSGGRHGYNWSDSPVRTGQWLSYGGLDQSMEAASPEQKRKQRDRALSMGSRPGTSRGEPSQTRIANSNTHPKDEALFRKVYSSFAPMHDDSMALVPEQVKNQLWYRKVGQKRAERAHLVDPILMDPILLLDQTPAETDDHENEDEEAAFAKAVEAFQPSQLEKSSKTQEERDTDELLEEISELIETLHSYQLIRNSSLSKPSTPKAQEVIKSFFGTPSAPSEAEHEVYKTLRAQLTLLVASLPPYILARLDGDRLKELNVSTNILIETSDDRGIMEEDQTAKLAKQASSNTTSARHLPATNSTPAAAYSTPQYSRISAVPSVTANHSARPSTTSYGTPQTYFPQNQQPSTVQQSSTGARPTAPLQYQRTASGVQTYVGSYPTQTPRQSYTPQQQQGYGPGMRSSYGISGGGSATGTPSAPQQQPATASQYLARLQQQQAQANSNAAVSAKPNYSSYYANANATATPGGGGGGGHSSRPTMYAGHSQQASQSPAPTPAGQGHYPQRQGYNPSGVAAAPGGGIRQGPASSSASPMVPAASMGNPSSMNVQGHAHPQKNGVGLIGSGSGASTPNMVPPQSAVNGTVNDI